MKAITNILITLFAIPIMIVILIYNRALQLVNKWEDFTSWVDRGVGKIFKR